MSMAILHDGSACAEASATSRALQYGDGVFRTMLWSCGEVVDWPLHMRKLAQDCAALALDMPAEDALAADVRRVADGKSTATVKIVVARRSSGRGYVVATSASERWVYGMPAPTADVAAYQRGIESGFSDVLLSEQPLLAGVKHLNRLDQVLASRNWPEGIGELLMRGAHGDIVCGTRTNLFCVVDGALITPSLDRSGVAGIMRARIIELARAHGLAVSVAPLRDADIARADELFVCNALIGLWPVRRIGGWARPAPGSVTRTLMQALRHPSIPT